MGPTVSRIWTRAPFVTTTVLLHIAGATLTSIFFIDFVTGPPIEHSQLVGFSDLSRIPIPPILHNLPCKFWHFCYTWCEPLFSPSFHKSSATTSGVLARVLSSVSWESAPTSCSTPLIYRPQDPAPCILFQLLSIHSSKIFQFLYFIPFLPLRA